MPKPLDATQTAALVEQLKNPEDPPEFLLELLKERVPPGVDEAAYVKARLSQPRVGKMERKVDDQANELVQFQVAVFL